MLLSSLLVICIFKPASSQQNNSTLIGLGSSISTNIHPTSWRSPSGTFAFGFYPQGSGFIVGIWLVCKPADIITWTAFRDDPPVPLNATLELTGNGKLLLRTYYANNGAGEEKLVANIERSASNARMFDSGNLVLYNEHSDVIWESFKFPTDTILGGQNLSEGGELISSASTTNSSTGRFHLKMQIDGNLVSYPIDTIDTSVDAYWNTATFDSSVTNLYLNYTGGLLILSNDSNITVFSSDSKSESNAIIYRATLEYDGIFRLYSHNFDSNGAFTTSLICLPGTVFVNPNQRNKGCKRNYTEELCKVAEETSSYRITDMEKMSWDDFPYSTNSMSEEDCRKSCLQDCNCAETNVSTPEEVELCIWAYELLVARELGKLDLGVDVDLENFEKMVMVGIWCIQDEPGIRPSMKSVVSMLEGITGVSVPPNPTSASTSA
ncbi:G-TYPE LECTIN S-RECEPTOR-LIKE SERINE/THREONINE-PROTEIN KINASE LECRK1 [Salix purpurea]|uniref:G-TYPE LECTIN S-RECEPTOR-LIKE SERINE/THREONINE-PROTEIN KINASE LECRK1 n=1 Tax=Salix purpurea TaxID=77065 RepID=A0A9Q0V9X3_SALPP|nr:G-TYPE LECTIN S-RECEPTOR-LIKE SERINE/THREONINE-PROTEIN KINASE LECRK1 [Salix purpurea]